MLSEIELSLAIFFLPSPPREADIASLAGRATANGAGSESAPVTNAANTAVS
jgi:hypothetical protein